MEVQEFSPDIQMSAPVDQFDVPEAAAYHPESNAEVMLATESAEAYVSDLVATLNRPGFLPDRNRIDAYDAYIADSDFAPQLRELGALLIDARQYAKVSERLEMSEDMLRRGIGDRHQLREHVDKDKDLIVDFDHQLREWMTANGENLQASQVADWVYSASGDEKWATSRVRGISGEIAIGRDFALEAQGDGPIKEVFYTTKEDDKQGMDLVLVVQHPSGQTEEVGIDAKTVAGTLGYTESFTESPHQVDGKRVFVISIASSEIGQGFTAERRSLDYPRHELYKALGVAPAETKTPHDPRPVSAVRHAKSVHQRRAA